MEIGESSAANLPRSWGKLADFFCSFSQFLNFVSMNIVKYDA
jgi:hypothetical protein